MRNMIRGLFTGKDNKTHDLGRWSWAGSWAAVTGAGAWNAVHGATVDLMQLATALGAIAVAAALSFAGLLQDGHAVTVLLLGSLILILHLKFDPAFQRYAELAVGFTLVFGLMRNVNLAHGSLYLLGGYVGYVVAGWTGWCITSWK